MQKEGKNEMQSESKRIINSLICRKMDKIEYLTGLCFCDYNKDLEVECIEAMDSDRVVVKNTMIAKLMLIIDSLEG
jgi:hypothetical protein